jgi:hypothetical protein
MKMKGTEKQIKWAEDIKAKMNFNELKTKAINPMVAKGVNFVEAIENAEFWILYRDHAAGDIVRDLFKGGILVRGAGYTDKAKADVTTGIITTTKEKIIDDGKGGHIEIVVTDQE